MYRLTIVSGPNRGASYGLDPGENFIGRSNECKVVLTSGKVSKRHCVLVASDGKILLRDEGSSNGTFVNGVLTKARTLGAGDRISVGEFVLEVSESVTRASNLLAFPELRQADRGGSNFPVARPGNGGLPGMPGAQLPQGGTAEVFNAAQVAVVEAGQVPNDLKGKVLHYFENYVMPPFYGMNLKNEWKAICAGLFAVFLLVNMVVSVQPLLDENKRTILNESKRRAQFIARQVAERNSAALAAGAETRADIGAAESSDGVSLVVLVDLDQRIIAPAGKMNQYLVAGAESHVANDAARKFKNGASTFPVAIVEDTEVVAVEPVMVYNAKASKNIPIAMAVVAIDGSTATMGMGEVLIIYSKTLVYTAILGFILLLILYRLTLKPFQILNEDMDKALKGDIQQVTHEFRFEELNPLWDLINSAIQRLPRAGNKAADAVLAASNDDARPDQFVGPMKMAAEAMQAGLVVCGADRRIVFMNDVFEELSGIRADAAVGQEIGALARDQSLGVLTNDIFDRVRPGAEGIVEDYEFSGVNCSIRGGAFGPVGESPKAYAMIVTRKAE